MPTMFLDLVKTWVVCVGVACMHTAILGFNVGRLRGVHKSWLTEEDKVKNGGIVGDVPEVQRGNAAHRNQLENLPLFIGSSVVFIFATIYAGIKKSDPEGDYQAGCVLFVVWTFMRLGHSVAYLNALQPWRTVCFLVGQLTMFTISLYAIINVLANA